MENNQIPKEDVSHNIYYLSVTYKQFKKFVLLVILLE